MKAPYAILLVAGCLLAARAAAQSGIMAAAELAISNRVTASSPTQRAAFIAMDPGTTNFARNPKFWLAGVHGLTGISPARDVRPPDASYQACVTLVTPQHVYAATHNLSIRTGDRVWFVNPHSLAVARTILAVTNMGNDSSFALLDRALPPEIEPLRVFRGSVSNTPAVGFSQEEFASIHDATTGGLWFNAFPSTRYPDWAKPVQLGDSGRPLCLLLQDELVWLGGWSTLTSGVDQQNQVEAVNAALAGLSAQHGQATFTLQVFIPRPEPPRNLRLR